MVTMKAVTLVENEAPVADVEAGVLSQPILEKETKGYSGSDTPDSELVSGDEWLYSCSCRGKADV